MSILPAKRFRARLAKVLTLNQFGNQIDNPILLTKVMDGDNPRMIQSAGGLCFHFKTGKALDVIGE